MSGSSFTAGKPGTNASASPGAKAFQRDIPSAKVVFYNTGHFALETHVAEITAEIRSFLDGRA